MKQLLFLWLLVLSAFSVKCQDATAVLQIADEMPKYLTGDTGLYNFIRQNIQYPQLCLDSGIQGKVYLRFVVGADGQIKKTEVIKGVCSLLNEEALRVVNKMPPFIPAKNGGKNVDAYYAMPISFVLPEKRIKPISSYYSVISTCDIWPQYVGGDDSLEDYFYYHVPIYREGNQVLQGNVFAGFIVDTLGNIGNVRIINDTADKEYGRGLTYPPMSELGYFADTWDSSIYKIVMGLGKFKPAIHNGQKVNSYVVIRWSLYKRLRYPENSFLLPTPPKILGGEGYLYSLLNAKNPRCDNLLENRYIEINLNFMIDTIGILTVEDPLPDKHVSFLSIYRHAVNALRGIKRRFTPAQNEDGSYITSYYSVWLDFYHYKKKFYFDNKLLFLYKSGSSIVYYGPEKRAEFPGGDSAMANYLNNNLIYPEYERHYGIQGRTCVRVTIDENGIAQDAKMWVSMSDGINKESLRLGNSLPPFIPAEHHGKKVKSYYYFTISFRL